MADNGAKFFDIYYPKAPLNGQYQFACNKSGNLLIEALLNKYYKYFLLYSTLKLRRAQNNCCYIYVARLI